MMQVVPNWRAATRTPLIQQWLLPGTHISNRWAVYNNLNQLNGSAYLHDIVIHTTTISSTLYITPCTHKTSRTCGCVTRGSSANSSEQGHAECTILPCFGCKRKRRRRADQSTFTPSSLYTPEPEVINIASLEQRGDTKSVTVKGLMVSNFI